ncbi:unnamed protein product [Blepharisma stoltei]|uniref:WW domain-containing protein n=1 Tax=Blepharisma stoltei TaxID=1481888 RepID=A0AAU9JG04_9CILI|nr:unnamed protein product [Blepharisma stoltei]
MSGSLILDEEIDEAYEPTQEEILDYAKWLGMKLPEDKDFLYIAKEGLKAPLPEPWKACQNKEGEIYFFNFQTGESVWDHPCDKYYKDLFQELKTKKSKSRQSNHNNNNSNQIESQKKTHTKQEKPRTSLEKADPLLEITQLEKEWKKKLDEVKKKGQQELEDFIVDLQKQKVVELAEYRGEFDKDLRKKGEAWKKQLEDLEIFEASAPKKVALNLEENKKLIENERKRLEDQANSELELYRREESQTTQVEINSMKATYDLEVKRLEKDFWDQKVTYESSKVQSDFLIKKYDEDLIKEGKKLEIEFEEKLKKMREEKKNEINRLNSTKNTKKLEENLSFKVQEMEQRYKIKVDNEKRIIYQDYEKELSSLKSIRENANETPEFNQFSNIHEKKRIIDDIQLKYQASFEKEKSAIDREIAIRLESEKNLIESEFAIKKKKIIDERSVPIKEYPVSYETEMLKTINDIDGINKKIHIKDEEIERIKALIYENSKELQKLTIYIDQSNTIANSANRIEDLKREIESKNKIIAKLSTENPDKIQTLEEEINKLKRVISNNPQKKKRIEKSESEESEKFAYNGIGNELRENEIFKKWRNEKQSSMKKLTNLHVYESDILEDEDIDLSSPMERNDLSRGPKKYGEWMNNLQEDLEHMIDHSRKIRQGL